jgi:recombinational DNA repair protein (RecF pathway)
MNLYTPALEPALAEYEEALALWKADRCDVSRLFDADEEMLHASRPYASELRLVAQRVAEQWTKGRRPKGYVGGPRS